MKKTARSFSMLGLLALLPALSLGTAGCGGSEASPPRDGAVGDVAGTGGTAGTPGAGGTAGTPGAGGTGGAHATGGVGAGGSAAGGVGGSAAGGAGGAGGAIGGAGGTGAGGAGGTDAGPAPADAHVDLPFSLDALGDSAPMVVACPSDVTTATCSTGVFCVKNGGEACGCTQAQKWFCPGVVVGDGGVGAFDAGSIPDLGNVPMCAAGTANFGTCTTEGTYCRGVGTLGCACVMVAGGLRWACL